MIDRRKKVRCLLRELEMLSVYDEAARTAVMTELFGSIDPVGGVGCCGGYLEPWASAEVVLEFDVFINYNAVILDCNKVTIGSRVLFGPTVQLLDATHPAHPVIRNGTQGPEFGCTITICDDVWLGAGATIMPNVTVGAGALVGAGAVVTRDVEPLSVVAGNPARLLRRLAAAPTKEEVEFHTVTIRALCLAVTQLARLGDSSAMGEHKELNPPLVTSILTFTCFTAIFLLGKLRDLFRRRITTKGFAPLREAYEDFYQRRMFFRIRDCWNRPIASAPDAWIDVMERSDLGFTSGFRPLHLLETTKRCLNLGSYNYLGFAAADEYCTPRVQSTMAELGVSTCSSRADAGTTPAHLELEELVAEFIGTEAALTFGMGYATNSATIPALAGKGCLIISDALNHASIVAGARASGAKVKVFRHNDPQHLDAVLKDSIAQGQPRTHRPWKKILIIVEGIYSMEGEVCALPEIVAVKKKYGAYLYLDEAHSIGAMGKHGRGVCEHWGVNPRDVDIMMGTFTKSFGSCGGYIAGSHQLVKYLQANSPAHLYATAMSAPSVQQVSSAIRLLRGEDGTTRGRDKVRQLHDNANYLRRRLTEAGLHVLGDWDSPVMPLMIYSPAKLPAFSRMCLARNVAVVVVGFPATALLLTRARLCISAAHTPEDIDYAVAVLEEVCGVCMMKYGRQQSLPPLRDHPTDPASVPPPNPTHVGQRSPGYQADEPAADAVVPQPAAKAVVHQPAAKAIVYQPAAKAVVPQPVPVSANTRHKRKMSSEVVAGERKLPLTAAQPVHQPFTTDQADLLPPAANKAPAAASCLPTPAGSTTSEDTLPSDEGQALLLSSQFIDASMPDFAQPQPVAAAADGSLDGWVLACKARASRSSRRLAKDCNAASLRAAMGNSPACPGHVMAVVQMAS
ncbi:hypothetical protein QJQ45_024829 [Haematococcus lacustris]|nr:hypothetical protein QJQ45_024829 [Haematococcus lacustris]